MKSYLLNFSLVNLKYSPPHISSKELLIIKGIKGRQDLISLWIVNASGIRLSKQQISSNPIILVPLSEICEVIIKGSGRSPIITKLTQTDRPFPSINLFGEVMEDELMGMDVPVFKNLRKLTRSF